MHDDQRMTDSVAMRSSCSRSPSPIVRFLLLWMPNILDPMVLAALLTSPALFSISFASCPKLREELGNISSFPKLASPWIASTLGMLVENSNAQLPCSITEPGLKNAKLGIEGTGEENSKALESLLRKEKPPDAKQDGDGSTRKEEKDDLHVNVGDGGSQAIGDPDPKLAS